MRESATAGDPRTFCRLGSCPETIVTGGDSTYRRELDDVDRSILRILQADGRTALSEIARRVDMGTATIHERTNTLESQGYIRGYHAELDTELLGFDVVAFVQVHTEAGRFSAVAERLAEEPAVHEIHEITGEADLLCKVRLESRIELSRLLTTIGEYDGVTGTATNVALRSVKEESRLHLDDE